MNLMMVAFVAATVSVMRLPMLPDGRSIAVLGVVGLALVCSRRTRLLGAFIAGAVYASSVASIRLGDQLPAHLEGVDMIIEGVVWSLPEHRESGQRFQVRCAGCWADVGIILSIYDAELVVQPGELWRFPVRLQRPRGLVNPGLFDYEGWLLAQNVAATGYVVPTKPSVRLRAATAGRPHHQVRTVLRDAVIDTLKYSPTVGLVVALTIGDSSAMTAEEWEVLSRTGTNHLLVISGLHVGLIATGSLLLTVLVFRMFGAQTTAIASCLSFACACAYGALAGFGLPVQRALIMAGVALWGVIRTRTPRMSTIYCLALFGVTLLDPFASLGGGFWLSFGAVAVLLYGFGARMTQWSGAALSRWLWLLLWTQWTVFVGMAPILFAVVGQLPIIAFIANLIAIPWISILVIPVLLLGCILVYAGVPGSDALIRLGDFLLFAIWRLLDELARLDLVHREVAVDRIGLVMAFVGVMVILAPKGILPRWIGICLLLPMLLPRQASLPEGAVELTVLDVGQGLAVVLRSSAHTVVFDTGPRYGDRFDAGRQIVTPYLRSKGVTVIDDLILSHGDIDHSGGFDAVLAGFRVNRVWGPGGRSCQEAQVILDGSLRMEIPGHPAEGSGNDLSCMLIVEADGFSILLPGDIEAAGERYLMARNLPAIDLLVAPHHGSASSSGPGFLNHVDPDYAVFSAGYRNRFGHPVPAVLRRYQLRGIRTFSTANDGAVIVSHQPGELLSIRRARCLLRRFWYD